MTALQANVIRQENVERIRELLDKFQLEKRLIYAHSEDRQHLEEVVLERQQASELERRLAELHVADLAELINTLPAEDRQLVWIHAPLERRGDMLCEMDDAVRETLIEQTPEEDLLKILGYLDADDLTLLVEDLPKRLVENVLASRQSSDREWVEEARHYPSDRAGYWMSRDLVSVRFDKTLGQVQQKLVDLKVLPAHTDKLFVTDQRGVLVGVIKLQEILMRPLNTVVSAIMDPLVVQFSPQDAMEEVVRAFEKYNLVSAAIVNERGKLAGRLTVDLLMDYVRHTAEIAALNAAGVREAEDIFSGVWDSARNRWMWLGINLVTAFLISRIIGMFESTIEQLVALAALMPIVASVAGNTGNQTAALVIRGIATDQVNPRNVSHVFKKEMSISALNGVVWGFVVGLFAFFIYGSESLALVIATAMMMTFLLAALVGVGAPAALQMIGRDPAKGTSVIVTGVTDALGFLVFLSLATLFLV